MTVVGDPISEEELETLHQKQASYGIQSVQLKVNQVQNSPTLDSEATKEFYETLTSILIKNSLKRFTKRSRKRK